MRTAAGAPGAVGFFSPPSSKSSYLLRYLQLKHG